MTLSKTTKLFARYTVAEENTQEKRALATDAGFASIDPDYRERRGSRTMHEMQLHVHDYKVSTVSGNIFFERTQFLAIY